MPSLHVVEICLKGISDHIVIGAVHNELYALSQKGVVYLNQVVFQSQQAFSASFFG